MDSGRYHFHRRKRTALRSLYCRYQKDKRLKWEIAGYMCPWCGAWEPSQATQERQRRTIYDRH